MLSKLSVQDTFSFTLTRTRFVRDGMVGVVHAPNYGAGFGYYNVDMALDPVVVETVLEMEATSEEEKLHSIQDKLRDYVKEKYGFDYQYSHLSVQWVPQGCSFVISEFDGSESVVLKDDVIWSQA